MIDTIGNADLVDVIETQDAELERNREAIAELVGVLQHINTDLVLGKDNEAMVSAAIAKHTGERNEP